MAGEDNFDGSPVGQNADSPAFREQSLPRVHSFLQGELQEVRIAVQGRDAQRLAGFILGRADDLNRVAMGAEEQDDISSTPDTAIMHAFGMAIWRKPTDTQRIEADNVNDLVSRWANDQTDMSMVAKGVYFSEVLLHKYKNGNGRVARGLKLLLDRANESFGITEDDTRQVLGIGRESLTQTGEHSFKINFNPDLERLVLGVAYFGLAKGLTQEQVIGEMRLNGTMPEEGLDALSKKLGVPKDRLKEEFIKFMVVDSELEWCDFDKN